MNQLLYMHIPSMCENETLLTQFVSESFHSTLGMRLELCRHIPGIERLRAPAASEGDIYSPFVVGLLIASTVLQRGTLG